MVYTNFYHNILAMEHWLCLSVASTVYVNRNFPNGVFIVSRLGTSNMREHAFIDIKF